MSASTMGPINQDSPRKFNLVKRPQSADILSTFEKNRHITFNFNDHQSGSRFNKCSKVQNAFEELEVEDLSLESCSMPAKNDDHQSNDEQLEPGLTSKPPIPPTILHSAVEYDEREKKNMPITFDDSIALKFQRWFPNSVSNSQPSEIGTDVSLKGMSYEYSQRVIDKDKGTITYTRSSSSMSIRGSEDHLDEENLYSNLNAAISCDNKLKSSMSVDLLEILHNNDNHQISSGKKKKKKVLPVASKLKKEILKSGEVKKNLLKCKIPGDQNDPVKDQPKPVNISETKKDYSKKANTSPVIDKPKEEIVSWMSTHQNQRPNTPKHNNNIFMENTSTYEEIVSILKELESENDITDKISVNKNGLSELNNHEILAPEISTSSSKALWSFLDEVDKNSNCSTPSKTQQLKSSIIKTSVLKSLENKSTEVKKGSLQHLMELGKPELAQKVACLQLFLSEKDDLVEKLKITISELQAEHAKSKAEYESTVMRHQKFIDKVLLEKKELSEKCTETVKDLTNKMKERLASQEERHKVELKKAIEKQIASEKVKKDRWEDLKTKKLKELTIKGMEPELNRMSAAYQEEISELRRIHQTQIEEIESTWHRRMAAMRDKMDGEREQAVIVERETARNRLEMEIAELEKSYQEQRRRLLGEIHSERLRLERENEAVLMERRRSLDQKFEKSVADIQEKLAIKEDDFQRELKSMKESLESEKTAWIKNQTTILEDKETLIKEACKKERDRHIELVVQKLENEATEREKASDLKIKRIKSEFEADIHELENIISGLRLKLNEYRTKLQENEDKIVDLMAELNKNQIELKRFQETVSKLNDDLKEKDMIIKTENVDKIEMLKTELKQTKSHFEALINSIDNEKEKEINHIYVRVREAISRKDEAIQAIQSERDTALNQCSDLEIMLEKQRKEYMQLK
ncbi:centrosomal protein of 131 kDa isoform X2 [Daktulosphaira vitifoliae]|nr:centrosomal protein of 131 kDa isoform X2 [Daktulosphaira vitifoliae]XP_050544452.1 centrosomal protein of 131 kDa isoform X2 [Daktulosphaira vitifoliae]XP_050544453.1 centrosomal protein of 131 kDa isoform X2 [Daktulosphaira vitifoliae]XP_050544454.1 centrosomal protein of 131 kDa isoform X2 [Daktulosphaira vitifoliae]